MSLLHNLWTTASTNKHNASHTSALLWLCVQRDKEPLGVRMVSSPVSRDAGTQPDNQPARSQRFTHGIRTRSVHTPPFIVNLHLHRLGAVFEAIEPKLVQKKVSMFCQITITPSCCLSIETTLGVSLSISLLGLRRKVLGRNVKPEPPNDDFSHYIYIT